jgi:Uma2 family endonuclease
MYLTITQDGINLSPGAEVILRQQTWADYEHLIATRQDKAGVKIYFNASTQEIRIMAPLPKHGKRSAILSDLVKCLLKHQGQDWEDFDPLTLKRSAKQGIEPDHCFYIQNRAAILGHERINLETDPPPDLAIEVDLTSFTKPEEFLEIKIPELWIYRGQTLGIYLFDGTQYQGSQSSLIFPEFAVKTLIPEYVELAWTSGSSFAIREFEKQLG